MQTTIILIESVCLVVAFGIFFFNWLYKRRVAKTQTSIQTELPTPLHWLLRVSFFVSFLTVILVFVLFLSTFR